MTINHHLANGKVNIVFTKLEASVLDVCCGDNYFLCCYAGSRFHWPIVKTHRELVGQLSLAIL